jgi:hypothetical protein
MSLSPSKKNAGNFNLVPVRAVDRLHTRLRGRQGVTSKAVHAASRDRRTFPTALFVLNALYVLVATGRASVDRRHHSKELYFNVRL